MGMCHGPFKSDGTLDTLVRVVLEPCPPQTSPTTSGQEQQDRRPVLGQGRDGALANQVPHLAHDGPGCLRGRRLSNSMGHKTPTLPAASIPLPLPQKHHFTPCLLCTRSATTCSPGILGFRGRGCLVWDDQKQQRQESSPFPPPPPKSILNVPPLFLLQNNIEVVHLSTPAQRRLRP